MVSYGKMFIEFTDERIANIFLGLRTRLRVKSRGQESRLSKLLVLIH